MQEAHDHVDASDYAKAQKKLRKAIELAPTDAALKQREPLALWCVHVREDRAPPGVKALEWFLLTTIAIDTATITGITARRCLRLRL